MIRDVKKTGATYSTIAAAEAASVPGDIIEIQDSGVYNEQLTIGVENLTIQAALGCTPEIWAAAWTITVSSGIAEFALKGTSTGMPKLRSTGTGAECLKFSTSTTITVDYVNFYNNFLSFCLASVASTGLVSVTNCLFNNTRLLSGTFANVSIVGNRGILGYVVGGSPSALSGVFRRNNITLTERFSDNEGITWGTGFDATSNYIDCINETAINFFKSFYSGFTWRNNTIICSAVADNMRGFVFSNFTPYACLTNNIILGFKSGIYTINKTGNFGDYNCLYGNTDNYDGDGAFTVTPGANDIETDPGLVNYLIPNDSPCRNTGTTIDYSLDLLGMVRPQGSAFDIGCYEYPVYGVLYAYQDTVQSVIVVFHDEMNAVVDGANSAINEDNYAITGSKYTARILSVEQVTTRSYRLRFDSRVDDLGEYTITTSNLWNNVGDAISPATVTATGTYVKATRKDLTRDDRDIAGNIPTEDGYDDGARLDATGDLMILSKDQTIKKMIETVCLTQAGAILYQYGFGSDLTLKGPLTTTVLVALKRSVIQNVVAIPGVKAVDVQVSANVDKVIVTIKARTVGGIVSTATAVEI